MTSAAHDLNAPPALAAASLLRLLWLASPALPVGGFSYSEGLEPAVDAGLVADESSARAWLLDHLQLVLARADLPLVAAAWRAWQQHDTARARALNDWALATRESAELRLQTEQMGRSLADWLHRQAADDARIAALAKLPPAPAWPVVFGLAAWRSGAPVRESLLAFGFGWAENMVQAAVKAVPLGQHAGQRVLAALADALPGAVERSLSIGDEERQAFAPGLAILSSRHETQYSRLFRS